MTWPYMLEPVGPAKRYNVQSGSPTGELADPPNVPYHKGRTLTKRLGRMGREIP
jgi:hypothetical protein